MFGEVTAVLAGDPGDEGLGRRHLEKRIYNKKGIAIGVHSRGHPPLPPPAVMPAFPVRRRGSLQTTPLTEGPGRVTPRLTPCDPLDTAL